MKTDADILIIGGGLVGLTTALACAHKGASVILLDAVDPKSHLKVEFDGRASAIAASSYQMFRRLGLEPTLTEHVQPITDIMIADGDVTHGTSPLTLHFDAQDVDGSPMGYMIENRRLRTCLVEAVQGSDKIKVIAPVKIEGFENLPGHVRVQLKSKPDVTGAVLVAADGRNSFCRTQAGIGITTLPYKQKAIVTTVQHEKPHHGVAHELFLPGGPFAILPLTDNRANIVWSDNARAVDAAMALDDAAFLSELSRRFGDMYGEISLIAPKWAYPLSMQMAEDYVQGRLALIGDAAHAIHPIAGQGLNMGLRDAAALADIVMEAQATGQDLATQLPAYALWRNADNHILAASTDIFNRLFSNSIAPIRHARRLGLALVDRIAPARSFFIREASGRLGDLPTLLR